MQWKYQALTASRSEPSASIGISDTEITVELEFDGNIDTDATLTFTVGADAIAAYNGPSLTAQIPVTATTEAEGPVTEDEEPDGGQPPEQPEQPEEPGNEGITPTTQRLHGAPLTEATLHESVVTLTLSGGTYARSREIRDAVAVAGIDGVTFSTRDIERVSDTEITIELEFNGNIDTDTTLTFTVGARRHSSIQRARAYRTNTRHRNHGIRGRLHGDAIDRNHATTESIVTLTLSGGTYARSREIRDAVGGRGH